MFLAHRLELSPRTQLIYPVFGFFLNCLPQSQDGSNHHPTRVLLVSDPQVLDHRSYPDRAAWLTSLSQYMVDLNMRKSWWATKKLNPDVLIFLGDMMDGGRFAMPDAEYVPRGESWLKLTVYLRIYPGTSHTTTDSGAYSGLVQTSQHTIFLEIMMLGASLHANLSRVLRVFYQVGNITRILQ